MKKSSILLIAAFISFTLKAQDSTFESVIKIFENSCSSASCHGAEATHPLKLEGSLNEIYTNLINIDPTNPAAFNRRNKQVVPGDPTASFLYRKVNNGLYSFDEIKDEEGTPMPIAGNLSDVEKETIRQWILWGAPKEGLVHNEAILTEYYVDKNAIERVEPLEAPINSEGFQYQVGTIFLAPSEEIEIMKLIEVPLGDSLEITGFEIKMNEYSHHYALNRILNGFENEVEPGFVEVDNFLVALNYFDNSELVTVSQFPENIYLLSDNVAYRWENSANLSINYHIKNYSTTSILPAEAHLNIYTQSKNIAEKEMRAETVTYQPDGNPFALEIFGDSKDTVFVMEHYLEGSNEIRDIWQLTPHTHSRGVDFDIFVRNADGSKGEQVYEGFYNYELDFNQGFYDFTHVAMYLQIIVLK